MGDEVQEPKTPVLTLKQQAFVDAYVGEAKGNATKAALLAGYAERGVRVQGHRLLTNANIQQAISERASEYAMSPAEVLAETAAIARMDASEFITVPEMGKAFFDFKKAEKNKQLGFIKKLSYTKYGPSVELVDKQAALVQIGKYHGLWVDKQEQKITLEGGVNIYLPQEDEPPTE